MVKEKVENASAVESTPQRKPARRCMALLSATNVGPYSVLARKPSAHPAGKHPQKTSRKRETVSRESEGPAITPHHRRWGGQPLSDAEG